MFLVVFVTFVVSVIGLYAQVLTAQTARLNASQYGLMQTMLGWHATAVTLGKNIPMASFSTTGCNLTTGTCPVSSVPASGLLPPGYNGTYKFNSIAFQSTAPTGYYVVTYVHDVDGNTGTLILPGTGGTTIGTRPSDLLRQFATALPTYMSYGTVTSTGVLTISARADGSGSAPGATYSIPTGISTGSIALISAAQ